MAETKHATEAYKIWQAAADKFDYHLATIAAAVTAWSVQTMTLTGLDPASAIQVGGLGLLGGSTYLGLRRIEGSVQLYLMSLNNATNTDRYSALVKQEISNNAIGERPDVEKVQRFETAMNAHKASTKAHAKSLKRPYKWRNRLLIWGLVVYAFGRGWAQVAAIPVPPPVPVQPPTAAAKAQPAMQGASAATTASAPTRHASPASQGPSQPAPPASAPAPR